MKRFYLFSLCLVLSFCSGCESTMKFFYGIKSPSFTSQENVRNYLVKHQIDTAHLVYFNSFSSMIKASRSGFMSFPNAIFYNKAGKRVLYDKSANDCNAKVDVFLSDLRNIESATITDDDLTELTSLLTPCTQEMADINVFITWSTYSGRLNKTKAFDWVRLIEQAKRENISINYYLLSGDYMLSWQKEIEDAVMKQG